MPARASCRSLRAVAQGAATVGATMPISVACPVCGAKSTAPDAAAGRLVKCPKCRAALKVPGFTPPSQPAARLLSSALSGKRLGAVALSLCVLTGGLTVFFTLPKKPPNPDALYGQGRYAEAVTLYKEEYGSLENNDPRKVEILRRIVEFEVDQHSISDDVAAAMPWIQKGFDDGLDVPYESSRAKYILIVVKNRHDEAVAAKKAAEEAQRAALEAKAKKEEAERQAQEKAERERIAKEEEEKRAKEKERREKAIPTISHRIIEEWTIPNGGYGRIIVIDPVHRNEKDMRMLGDQLRSDTKKDRNAFIWIYDDEKAARVRKAALAERLNKKDLEHHDKHVIGDYARNANTGFHALIIFLEGLDGSPLEVKY